jgi:hypothetical protein
LFRGIFVTLGARKAQHSTTHLGARFGWFVERLQAEQRGWREQTDNNKKKQTKQPAYANGATLITRHRIAKLSERCFA